MKNPKRKEILEKWDLYYPKLVNFKKSFGHCNVPSNWEHDKNLAKWLELVRSLQSRLSKKRRDQLVKLGLELNYDNYRWNLMYQEFKSFVKKYKTAIIPAKNPQFNSLSLWVQAQREKRKNLSLTKGQITLLDKAGFVWDIQSIKDDKWYEYYKELVAYKRRYGDCLVPRNWPKNKALASWVERQRASQTRMKLLPDRKGLLDKLDFPWRGKHPIKKNVFDKIWDKNFKLLVAYKRKYGNLLVPYEWKENPTLSRWIGDQRMKFKAGKLSKEQKEKLEELGFVWNPIEDHWNERYKELVEYKKKFGHLKISTQSKEYRSLSKWASYIRTQKKNIDPERIKMLEKIGFDWTLQKRSKLTWMDMYKMLEKYKKKHGHVEVKRSENKKLYIWLYHQRTGHISHTPQKKSLLKKIGIKLK